MSCRILQFLPTFLRDKHNSKSTRVAEKLQGSGPVQAGCKLLTGLSRSDYPYPRHQEIPCEMFSHLTTLLPPRPTVVPVRKRFGESGIAGSGQWGPWAESNCRPTVRKCWAGPPSQSYQSLANWILLPQSDQIIPFGSYLSTRLSTRRAW
jgi:hypothetical protein